MAATCAVMGLNDVFKRADHCWQRLIKAWGGGLYEGWGVAGVFVRQDAAGGVAEKLLSPGGDLASIHNRLSFTQMQKSPDCAGFSGGSIGRGNLNPLSKLLNYKIYIGF